MAAAYDRDVSIYNDVLRELVAAIGAALFLGNLIALVRRRSGSKVAATRGGDTLPEAPIARTVVYLVIGFVVMIAGLAAMATK
jgi:hypothetical protein